MNTILLEKKDSIAIVTLNRPDSLNALNNELVSDLLATLDEVRRDQTLRVIILTGKGKAFCAGGDLPYLESLGSTVEARGFIAKAGAVAAALMELDKPVIAMVNGVAAGAGFNYVLACDIVYSAASARFAQSFARVGLVPDCGGTYLLPRIVGLQKAKELMFSADIISSETAKQLGFVNQVFPDELLAEKTYEFALRLAQSAPIALGYIKKLLNSGFDLPLNTMLEREADQQAICMQTADYREGVQAFKQKRQPIFTGT